MTIIEIIFSLATFSCGITAIIISLISLNHNKIEAINSFYLNDREERFIKARKLLHCLRESDKEYDPGKLMIEHGDEIAFLILSYDQAGVLVKKRQLPFWLFSKGGSGIACVEFYKTLTKYIEFKRKGNPLYAKNYEELVNRIEKTKKRSKTIYKS